MIKRLFQSLLLSFIMVSCIPNESDFEGFTKAQLQQLIAGGSELHWGLSSRQIFSEEMVLENCLIDHQIQFKYTASTSDKDSVIYINRSAVCPEVTDSLFGFWYVPTSFNKQSPKDSLVLVWNGMDTAHFLINELNPEYFEIATYKSDSLIERFVKIKTN